jgi:hypothetical protein
MEKVYVAGKLNDDACGYIKNLNNMVVYANKLKKLGFAVFVPGLDFLMGVVSGEYEYEDYFDNSQAWLKVSDRMFVCPGWETSKGTLKEIKLAKKLDIPITYDLKEFEVITDFKIS